MQATSQIAYDKVRREGTKEIHYKEILNTLKAYGELTNYGISQKSYLTYHQVGRRTGELRSKNLIKEIEKFKDLDGSIRMKFALV